MEYYFPSHYYPPQSYYPPQPYTQPPQPPSGYEYARQNQRQPCSLLQQYQPIQCSATSSSKTPPLNDDQWFQRLETQMEELTKQVQQMITIFGSFNLQSQHQSQPLPPPQSQSQPQLQLPPSPQFEPQPPIDIQDVSLTGEYLEVVENVPTEVSNDIAEEIITGDIIVEEVEKDVHDIVEITEESIDVESTIVVTTNKIVDIVLEEKNHEELLLLDESSQPKESNFNILVLLIPTHVSSYFSRNNNAGVYVLERPEAIEIFEGSILYKQIFTELNVPKDWATIATGFKGGTTTTC